ARPATPTTATRPDPRAAHHRAPGSALVGAAAAFPSAGQPQRALNRLNELDRLIADHRIDDASLRALINRANTHRRQLIASLSTPRTPATRQAVARATTPSIFSTAPATDPAEEIDPARITRMT